MSDTIHDVALVPSLPPPALAGERLAGAVLLRGGPFAGLAVGVVVVAAAVLVPAGLWQPAVALPVIMVGLALSWRLCRQLPVQPVPVWASVLAVLAAAGEMVWAAATHAEHIILRRDAGAYALYAQWLATRGGLPVDGQLEAFGGQAALAVPGFTLQSPAYFQVVHSGGVEVVPQFLVGAPAVYSLGWWASGWAGLLQVPAIVGGLGVFAVAALTARLIGPRWAPLAASALALAFPVLFTARSTYSEPVALVLVVTAVVLVVASIDLGAGHRALGVVAGLTFGVAGLVRVDVLTEVALLVPVLAVLALRRQAAAGPIALGALVGTAGAAWSGLNNSEPYLTSISASLRPLAAVTAILAVISLVVVLVGARRGWLVGGTGGWGTGGARYATGSAAGSARSQPGSGPGSDRTVADRPPAGPGTRWVAVVGKASCWVMLLAGLLLAIRPLWQTVRALEGTGVTFVRGLQRAQGLPVDGTRTYAEWSLWWVIWWLGPVVVGAAWVTVSVLAGRAVTWLLRRPDSARQARPPSWLVPAVLGLGSSLLTLWRPGITPDHPWADRRLVPVLLPTFVVAGIAAVAWAVRKARRRFPATVLVLVVAVGTVMVLVQPLIATSLLAGQRTEQGELEAVRTVCAALRAGDVVVAVDNRGFNEWPQVVRGVCRHPAATLQANGTVLPDGQLRESVGQLAGLVQQRGGRLVVLASADDRPPDRILTGLGLSPWRVIHLYTTEDKRRLASPPDGGTRLGFTVWLAPWESTAPG